MLHGTRLEFFITWLMPILANFSNAEIISKEPWINYQLYADNKKQEAQKQQRIKRNKLNPQMSKSDTQLYDLTIPIITDIIRSHSQ